MRHTGTQPIDTRRLTLRRYVHDDAEAMYYGWMADARVARWMFWQPYPSLAAVRDELARWIAGYADAGFYRWSVTLKDGGACIGSIGLSNSGSAAHPRWEPAYCLAHAHWGHGYASEALAGVVRYFFEVLDGAFLAARHAVENPQSGRVLQKAGFAYVRAGRYRQPGIGTVHAHFYRMERSDYETHRHTDP